MEEAICIHALYYTIWKKYGVLPERFNWQRISPDVMFYPLRPEFVESTYLLYQVRSMEWENIWALATTPNDVLHCIIVNFFCQNQHCNQYCWNQQATKNPFYLHVGRDILTSLNNLTRARCGYATVHSVLDMTLEDRMESFFLSETCKYLYLVNQLKNLFPILFFYYIDYKSIDFGSA